MLTEPVKLCQWNVTLTLVILNTAIHLQMKTTRHMREVSIKLANCNRNFATSEKCINMMVTLNGRIINFDVMIYILLTSKVIILAENVLLFNKTQED